MERQYITKNSNNNSSTNTQKSTLARTAITQKGTNINAPLTQQEIENQQYQQDRFEATKLEIQAKYGTITPQGQERLNLLQAKKAEFWHRYLAPVRRSKDFANIPLTRTEAESTQQIQAKLTIGAPGDKYEQEADRVASLVVNQIHAPVSVQPPQNLQRDFPLVEELQKNSETESIQRVDMPEEEFQRKPMLQLQAGDGGMAAPAELESSIQQARGGGQPLAENVRKPMERAFGADFSRVKIHADSQSDQLNQSIQAKAFTTDQDVFFRQGTYQPGSRGGQELIAHELTHVVQQNGGAVVQMRAWDTTTLANETKQYTDVSNEEDTKKEFEEMRQIAYQSFLDSEDANKYGREEFYDDNDLYYQSNFLPNESRTKYVRLGKWYIMQQQYRALTPDKREIIFKRHHIIPQNKLEDFYRKLSKENQERILKELKREGDDAADGLQVLKSLRSNLFLGPAIRGDDPKEKLDLITREGNLDTQSQELQSISKLMESINNQQEDRQADEIIKRLKKLEQNNKEIRIEPSDFTWKGSYPMVYGKGNWHKQS